MAADYTRDGLLEFLREAALAGRLNPATARSRMNAAHQLFPQLSDAESADLRRVDLDQLVARCHKLEDSAVRPEVLRVYRERLADALNDYFRFLDDPDSFVASARERRALRPRNERTARSAEEETCERVMLSVTSHRPDVIPIPIRTDHFVFVQNLPADLTAAEARKIARVIEAFADEVDEAGDAGDAS
jgi:hypothetical protein